MQLTLLGALTGGMLTLLSPCSVMLLPAFFAAAFASTGALLSRTAVFFAGLATTLVPLGLAAGTVGAWLSQVRSQLIFASTVVIIVLGVLLLAGVQLPLPVRGRTISGTGYAAVYALGLVYGLSGVCAGPLLGAALTLAASSGNPLSGGAVMLFFAIGMAVPLLVLALLWERLPVVRKIVRPRTVTIGKWHNSVTSIVSGIFTIVAGVLLLVTDGTSKIGNLLGYSEQAKIEDGVFELTRHVPDWLLVVVLVAVVGGGIAVWQSRKK